MPQSGIEPTSPAYKTGPHPLKVSRAYMAYQERFELPSRNFGDCCSANWNYWYINLVDTVGIEPTHFTNWVTASHTSPTVSSIHNFGCLYKNRTCVGRLSVDCSTIELTSNIFGGEIVESNSNHFRSPSVFKTVTGPACITPRDWSG